MQDIREGKGELRRIGVSLQNLLGRFALYFALCDQEESGMQ